LIEELRHLFTLQADVLETAFANDLVFDISGRLRGDAATSYFAGRSNPTQRVVGDIQHVIGFVIWQVPLQHIDSAVDPAARHRKVVLSGDGGDELFAGYDKYAVEQRERRRERIPAPIRRLLGDVGTMLPDGCKGRNFLRHIALTGAARCADTSNLFRPEMKRRLFQPEPFRLLSANGSPGPDPRLLARLDCAGGDWLSVMQYLDLKRYLALDILVKVDRMSMAHSLEVRPPLLDHKLVEFAATIPPELQLRGSTRKYIFKRALRGLLPDEIIDRPKRGFAIPLGRWFRGKLEGFVRDLLLSPTALQRGIFRPDYIEHLLALHKKGKELHGQLWTLISFEMWARTYLDA
jgi:asparagine synthase (glutamine-hydrolysing)